MARSRRPRRAMNAINVVPYIDVMLVLLVIFMVTTPMMQTGVVNLPRWAKPINRSMPNRCLSRLLLMAQSRSMTRA